MVLAEIIVVDCEHVLVRGGDSLHFFEKSDVVNKSAPKKPAAGKPSKVVIDDPANHVQVVLENGHVALVED